MRERGERETAVDNAACDKADCARALCFFLVLTTNDKILYVRKRSFVSVHYIA